MLKLRLQYFDHLMQTADSLEKSLILGKIKGRRRRGHQKMRWLARWHHWCNGHEHGQTLGDGEWQGGLACYSPCGHKESATTGKLNNNKWNNRTAFSSSRAQDPSSLRTLDSLSTYPKMNSLNIVYLQVLHCFSPPPHW